MHGKHFGRILQLVRRLRRHGLMQFNKEPNLNAPAEFPCVEMSFVGPQHAFAAFKMTHPSCS